MPRRILAIDGGGLKGMFAANFLATVEDAIGSPVADYFDLIAGTSSGGIIALGLGLGHSPAELVAFYEREGPVIFAGNPIVRSLRRFLVSKYSHQPLRTVLTRIFGDRRLGESRRRLLIPSLNLATGLIRVYKTAHHPQLERDSAEKVVDVALATVSAPTYFPIFTSRQGTPLVDGSMWAKNPVGMAVIEAVGVLGWPRDQLKVLSLGCTTAPLPVRWGRRLALGTGYWGNRIADVFMEAQSSSALVTAQVLAGYDNVLRVDPTAGEREFELDAVGKLPKLRDMGEAEAKRLLPLLKHAFFDAPAEPFTPCRPAEDGGEGIVTRLVGT